jgi:Restriction endonuclease/TIR domain
MARDIFLSYASEDKASVAWPLANAMRDRGWSIWFDEAELVPGDNLTAAIDRGLAEAEMAVVIFSPAFLGKQWPRRELEALLQRETAEGRKLIVPIWHQVNPPDVADLSPMLATRLSISTAHGIPAVVDQLERVRQYTLDLLEVGHLANGIGIDGRPLNSDDPARQTLDLSVVTFNDRAIKYLAANPQLLYELAPRQFEELVAELYSRAGFEVELTPASGDDGADVYAIRRDDLGSTLIVVQAKRYKPELKVKASAVRELYGTVDLANASAGVLITTSSFQPKAEEYAEKLEWRLSLKDYARLQEMLKTPAAPRRRL